MKKLKLILGLLILFVLAASIFYIYNELKPKPPIKEGIITPKEKTKEKEGSLEEPKEKLGGEESIKKPVLLLEKIFLYPIIEYPYIYAYDPEAKTIKEINLVDKTFKEIYKGENIKNLLFSEDKNGLLFKKDGSYYFLDILKDKLERLPVSVKTVFWYHNDPYGFILTENTSYLVNLKNTKEKFVDLYILNPKFDILDNGIVVYEDMRYSITSPLILITNEKTKVVIWEKAADLSVITNKKDLIFVSLREGGWKSYLIDQRGTKLKEFNFGTLKEKCTFDKVLICGVPKNQNLTNFSEWYYYKENFNDRLVIFDPKDSVLKYYDFDKDYDILNPTLTPLGVVFLNRLDNKLYQVSIEDFSFQHSGE